MGNEYYVIPNKPLKNKKDTIRFIAGLFVTGYKVDNVDLRLLKTITLSQLEMQYNIFLYEIFNGDYNTRKIIKDSVKLSYSPNSLFGISKEGMKACLMDLQSELANLSI